MCVCVCARTYVHPDTGMDIDRNTQAHTHTNTRAHITNGKGVKFVTLRETEEQRREGERNVEGR